MNCTNLKKGDKVIVYHKSFCEESKKLYTVKRVYKHKITLTNDCSYWKKDGERCISTPFCINKIIEIMEEIKLKEKKWNKKYHTLKQK